MFNNCTHTAIAEEGGAAEGLQHVADHNPGLTRQRVLHDVA